MKKIFMSVALFLALVIPAFAVTTIGDWEAVESGTAQYEGTQAGTAAAGMSANGLVYSRHKLYSYGEHYQATSSVSGTSTATGIDPLAVTTTEICVFCHTPHFGRVDTAPLWNRGSSATGYVAYGTTVGGTAITSVGGSSLACLSCHDGVTTFDNLINKPGKGSRTNGTGADQGGWIQKATSPPNTPWPPKDHFSTSACGTCHPRRNLTGSISVLAIVLAIL